jgi:uncharacterized membrane protein HdeD (DUF308 family)
VGDFNRRFYRAVVAWSPLSTTIDGVLMILGGLLLFARPVMAIGGLLALIALLMAADGVTKLVTAFKDKLGHARWWTIFNGSSIFACAADLWQSPSSA